MNRANELENAVKRIAENGGKQYQEWMVFCLTDIAVSLARIVDALEAEKGKSNDGSIEV